MRKTSTLTAAVAGLAFALAPVAVAQVSPSSNSSNAPSHVTDPRPETSPDAAQNNPDRGAQDPARVGTTTRSNSDMNNNRNPAPQDTTTKTTTSPSTTYETTTPASTTTVETAPAPSYDTTTTNTAPAYTAPVDTTTERPATLPRTASTVPLVALTGLGALGAALVLRSRR